MAVIQYFAGKQYIEPRIDVQIKNGEQQPNVSEYGKILMIDTGISAKSGTNEEFGYGIGSMVLNGTNAIATGTTLSFPLSLSSKSFQITTSFSTIKTVSITDGTYSTITALVSHINTQMAAQGVRGVYVYDGGSNNIVVKLVVYGASVNFILADVLSSLASLGLTAGTYTGTDTDSTNRSLQDFLYEFKTQNDLETATKGGYIYSLADYLYNPTNQRNLGNGAKTVYLINAKESKPAYSNMMFGTSGNNLTFYTKEEGKQCNGLLTSSNLYKGFAWKLVAGTKAGTYQFKFYLGTYKGVDTNGYLFENHTASAASLSPSLILQSPAFTTMLEFFNWAQNNEYFQTYFDVDIPTTYGNLTAQDITNYAGYNVFYGGTDTFSYSALLNCLKEIKELDYSFILSTEYAENAASINNIAILEHINSQRLTKNVNLHIGGFDTYEYRGDETSDTTATSAGSAYLLDSAYAILYHGGDNRLDVTNSKILRTIPALYQAAICVGRRAGLRPQDSLTYKELRSIKPQDNINDIDDRESLIQLGINITKSVSNLGIVIDLDINTLRGDKNLVDQTTDSDGSLISFHNELMQVKNELQRTFINDFTPNYIGTKANEYPVSMVSSYTNEFLKNAKSNGLILDYDKNSIVVTKKGTATYISATYTANTDNLYGFVSFTQQL